MREMKRRSFFQSLGILPLAAGIPQGAIAQTAKFKISLAQWSLHKAIQSRMITNLDFPRVAREQFGIEGLEFVNQLWEAPTEAYVRRLKNNMKQTGTTAVLIMCDGEGTMGHSDKATRMKAAENHYKWIDITAELGGTAIRTNMYPEKQPQTDTEVNSFLGYCSESFAQLCEYGQKAKVNVIIENHGGISSNPDVVVRLMKMVKQPNFGTLPDFGNFPETTDKYAAVEKLMPYAKGVSFKCHDFDAKTGNETRMDMDRMMKIVADAGWRSWVGIEYEGSRMTEFEGIQAAKRYLDRKLAQG